MSNHKPGRKHKGRADRGERKARPADGPVLIYGLHAAAAALANPDRTIHRLLATRNAAQRIKEAIAASGVVPEPATPRDLDKRLGAQAVHQGVLLETEPLPSPDVEDLPLTGLILVLDQVTDPHNFGAILRTAAAFGAEALITTRRHSPPLDGALAKAASGGMEHVPVVLTANLARALGHLGKRGVMRIGLDGAADETLQEVAPTTPVALVLGAEGKGLRQLTAKTCDRLARLDLPGPIKSLNVSIAAAAALQIMAGTQD